MGKNFFYIIIIFIAYTKSYAQIETIHNNVSFNNSNTNLQSIKNYLSKNKLDKIEGIWSWSAKMKFNGNPVNNDNYATTAIIKDTSGRYGEFIVISINPSQKLKEDGGYKEFDIIGYYNKTNIDGVYIYEGVKRKNELKGQPSSFNFVLEKSTFMSSDQFFYSNNIPISYYVYAMKTFPLDQKSSEKDSSSRFGSGTGFLLNNNGYVATNYHVIKGAKKIEVYNCDTIGFVAKTILIDSINDLAIIKIDKKFKQNIPYKLEQNCNTGEKVFAIGFPEISTLGFNYKVTDGIISSQTGIKDNETSFQTTASIQHGNSGGPLFNEYGNIVGINSGGVPSLSNVFYAVKIKYLRTLIKNSKLEILPIGNNSNSNKKLSQQVSNLNKFVFLIFTEY